MTAEVHFDPGTLFPPDKYVLVRGVPVFDAHESDGRNGKPRKITTEKLKRLANTCNRKFDRLGVATPLTLGHTKDGADVKEEDQPPIVGWSVKYSIGKLPDGRDALYSDWYVKKKFEHVIDEYPHRSIELWDARDDINPIALLKTAPERDLPIIRYSSSPPVDDVYRYTFSPPTSSSPTDPKTMPTDDKTAVMTDAVASETSSAKSAAADLAEMKAQIAEIKQFMETLMQAVGEGGDDGDDLLAPADGDDSDFDDDTDGEDDDKADDGKKSKPEPKADDAKTDDEKKPEKFEATYAGPGNTYTPEMKTKMSRDTTETRVDFKREIDAAVAIYRRENEDLRTHYNRSLAKEAVVELEAAGIDFGTPEEREEELTLFANLLREDRTKASFEAHKAKVAKKYKRKPDAKPDSAAVAEVARYARTDAPADVAGCKSDADLEA
jgi:hypothetical protein